jgi:hypothetical protein
VSLKALKWATDVLTSTPDMTSSERLVLLALSYHHHEKTGACFPRIAVISQMCGLKERATQVAIRQLCERGFVSAGKRVEHGRQRSNQYDLFGKVRGAAPCTPKAGLRGAAPCTPKAPRGVHFSTPLKNREGCSPMHPDREEEDKGLSSGGDEVMVPRLKLIDGGL